MTKNNILGFSKLLFILILVSLKSFGQTNQQFVRISHANPRFFETADGRPWIPIEINYPSLGNGAQNDEQVFRDRRIARSL
jgi:hypothetical protein